MRPGQLVVIRRVTMYSVSHTVLPCTNQNKDENQEICYYPEQDYYRKNNGLLEEDDVALGHVFRFTSACALTLPQDCGRSEF